MLCQSWLVWSLEHDEWYNDWPVLLDFDNERVEINHSKDEMSLTWNPIDPAQPIEPDLELEWRWRGGRGRSDHDFSTCLFGHTLRGVRGPDGWARLLGKGSQLEGS